MRIKTNLKVVAGPLELTPLVDVVFLLLIFFMISSSLVFWPGTQVDTEVELPRSQTSSGVLARDTSPWWPVTCTRTVRSSPSATTTPWPRH